MKLRLLPRQEDTYFDLFEAAADNIVAAARTLLDMLSNLGQAEALARRLVDLEHEGDRITRDILTRLATTFIARFDRDEIYTLAEGLDDVTDAIEEVGDFIVLHGIGQRSRKISSRPASWSGRPSIPPRACVACGSPAPSAWRSM